MPSSNPCAANGQQLFCAARRTHADERCAFRQRGAHTLTVGDADAIAELPGVQAVAADSFPATHRLYMGRTLEYLRHRHHSGLSGGAFLGGYFGAVSPTSDVALGTRVATDRQDCAENLFGDEDPVGKPSASGKVRLSILGTLAAKGQAWTDAIRTTPSSFRLPPPAPGIRQPVSGNGAPWSWCKPPPGK